MMVSIIRHALLHEQSADTIHCHAITKWCKMSFLKQHDHTDSVGLDKASLLSFTPNTSYLESHRLDFDRSLGLKIAFTFQKSCCRHGIEPLIWQDIVLFTSTVTYGGGGGGEMGGKGGRFASLHSSLSLFFNTVMHCNHSLNKLGSHGAQMSKPGFDSNSPTLAFACAIGLFVSSPLLVLKW